MRKHIDELEKVEFHYTSKQIERMGGRSYEEQLAQLGLYSLEYRRLKGDMIEVYKTIPLT